MFKIHELKSPPYLLEVEDDEENSLPDNVYAVDIEAETKDGKGENKVFFVTEEEANAFVTEFNVYSMRTDKVLDLDNTNSIKHFGEVVDSPLN